MGTLRLDIHPSVTDIDQTEWDRWFGGDYPFLTWRFLAGLETSGCTGGESGWRPFHLVLREQTMGDERVVAAAPGFLKEHSYGEYVFDWAWADAWHRSGRNYYPKLISAAPFTPATGPRIYCHPDDPDAQAKLLAAVSQLCEEQQISGWHVLFAEPAQASALSELTMHTRQTCQFHWFNRNYHSFDDFLATFSSRKRKNLRKERQQVIEQGLQLETLEGAAITPDLWAFFHHCYQITYAKRSGHGGYLTRAFFTDVCPSLTEHTLMVVAREGDKPVAAALYFRSQDTLYGRYWGCLREYDFLHFEACYYRGIEYCIAKGLQRFDPGAQGEHKIQRGFEPVLTQSSHWIVEAGFRDAIGDFCARERQQVNHYREEARGLLPFKETPDA